VAADEIEKEQEMLKIAREKVQRDYENKNFKFDNDEDSTKPNVF